MLLNCTLTRALLFHFPLSFGLTLLPSYALANKQCDEHARSPLEQSYCAIKHAGGGRNLPPLNQFRNNPKSVQRLLLSRDAKRYGVELPTTKPKTPTPSTPAASTTPVSKSTGNNTVGAGSFNQQAPTQQVPQTVQQPAPLYTNTNTLFDDCHLAQATIDCQGVIYQHQHNYELHTLTQEVFSTSNTLVLPLKQDTDFAKASDLRYLSDIYPIYIEKMLKIGLADSTMSLTKFAHTFQQSTASDTQTQDQVFSERFTFIYEQLKKERRQNSIRSRYTQNYPESIQQCMQLLAQLISCDNVKQNWIYLKQK